MKRAHLIAIAALCTYAVAVAIGTLWWPLGRDQGIFAWVGDVILSGGMPYRDAWEGKGPATHYSFALSQLLFGRSLWGIRLFDLMALAAGSVAITRWLGRFIEPIAVAYTTIVFVLLHLGTGYWATAQPDGWATFCVAGAGACVLLPEPPSARRRAVAGALVGLAALYKLLFLGFLGPLLLYGWLRDRGTYVDRVRLVAPMLLGCGAVLVLCLSWFWARGALDEFAEIQLQFNRSVHTQRHDWELGRAWGRTRAYLAWHWPLVLLAVVGLAALWRRNAALALTLLLQLGVALAFVVLQNKYYSYHWHPVRFALMVAGGFGLAACLDAIRRVDERRRGRVGVVLQGVLIVAIVSFVAWKGPRANVRGFRAHVTHTLALEDYYAEFKSYFNASFRFLSNFEVVSHLEAHSEPGDAVLVWGFEPMINFLSGRHSPTRFGYNYPVVASVGTPFEDAYRGLFMRELRADLPRYIVVGVGDHNSLMPKSSRAYLREFGELARLLSSRYRLETKVRGFEIWRRVDRAGGVRSGTSTPRQTTRSRDR